MQGRGFLGCVGVVVAIGAGLVVGWLVLDLMLSLFGAWETQGLLAPVTDPTICHQIGQLLVFSALMWAILALVLRPERIPGWLHALRLMLWVGAAFELAAWLALPSGSRVAWWALVLAVSALVTPWILARGSAPSPPSA